MDKPNLNVACRPLRKGRTNADLVRDLLNDCKDAWVCAGLVLLDCGFFSSGVMQEIREAGLKFIMPASRTSGIKRRIMEYSQGRAEAVLTYRLTTHNHKPGESFSLVIIPKEKGDNGWDSENVQERYLAYATNMDSTMRYLR